MAVEFGTTYNAPAGRPTPSCVIGRSPAGFTGEVVGIVGLGRGKQGSRQHGGKENNGRPARTGNVRPAKAANYGVMGHYRVS